MSERSKLISRLLKNRASREAYIGAKLKVLIPSQIRALRLKSQAPRQEDLASAVEMKQSRISAMETPGAVNFNLETLVRLASAFKVGLVVKFVPFSEMLGWENEFSQDAFNVVPIDQDTEFLAPALHLAYTGTPNASPTEFYLSGLPQTKTVTGPSGLFESMRGPKPIAGAAVPLAPPTQPGGGPAYEAVSGNAS